MKPQILTIDSFAGGRENFDDQSLINQDVHASGSSGIWSPNKYLTKSPGLVTQSSFTATASGLTMPWFWVDETVSTANKLFYRVQSNVATGGAGGILWGSGTTFTDSATPLGYTVGTVSVSGVTLISATGNGTSWAANASAGDLMTFNTTSSARFEINSVEDNTHLTLKTAIGQAVPTGTTYIIQQPLDFVEEAAASLNGILSMCTTGNLMQQYDGSNVTRNSSPPKAAYLAIFKNYQFAFRTSTAQSRLYWSTLKDPTTYPQNNNQDIDVNNGVGTGMFPYGNELIIFKNKGMYKVLGDTFDPANPQYFIYKISTPTDFVFSSNYSCAIHMGYLVFYGLGRFYRYLQGTLFVQDISSHIIRDLPKTFSVSTDSMSNNDQRINAIEFNNYYLCKGLFRADGSGGYNAFMLDSNWKWWYWPASDSDGRTVHWQNTGRMGVVPSTSVRPQLAISGGADTHLQTMDLVGPTYGTNYETVNASTFAISPTTISSTWLSKEFNIEYGTIMWAVVYIGKQVTGTNTLTFSWSVDQGSFVSQTLDMTTGRGQILRYVIPIQQKGGTLQLKLTHNTLNETFKLYAVKVVYENSTEERLV